MFTLAPSDISTIGRGMHRPECVLATKSGDLFCSDSRGGYNKIRKDGMTSFVRATGAPSDFMPNGIALLPNRDVLCANLAPSSGVWRMMPNGMTRPFLMEVDGERIPPVNFVGLDQKGRIWITVSTRVEPRHPAFKQGHADGFIILHDETGTRIVADNIGFTNEAIVDPSGNWLYVAETVAQRTSRFPILDDGQLGPRETVAEYGPGTFPDGFTFDAEGGVWLVSVASNRIIRVAPDGEVDIIFEDADRGELTELAEAFDRGEPVREFVESGGRRPSGNLASICFGGPDLQTVYMGALSHESIQHFHSPIKGAPLAHWAF